MERYHTLLQRKRTGISSKSDLSELAKVTLRMKSEPAPPEFREAMISLVQDRQSLRELQERIEQFLDSSTC